MIEAFADTTLLGFTLTTIWYVIILFVWVGLAFWPARVAARKGYSFFLFFLFSLFSFFIALLVAYMMPNKNIPGATNTSEKV
jgi:small-conductance mechanosensitive channel